MPRDAANANATATAARARGASQLAAGRWMFRQVFEEVPAGIALIDLEGNLLRCNRHMRELLGYDDPAEVEGHAFAELTHPQDLSGNIVLFHELVTGHRERYQLIKRYLRKDGRPIWVRVTACLVRRSDGTPLVVVATVEDLSELRRAEDERLASENKFRTIFQSVPCGMAMVTPQGTLLEVNSAFARMLGYDAPEDLIGLTVEAISDPDDFVVNRERLERAEAGELDDYQLVKRYRTRQGGVVWAEVSVTVLKSADGRQWRLIASIRDITEERRRQSLESLLHELDHGALVGKSLEELFALLCRRLVEHSPYPLALIGLKEPDGTVSVHTFAGYENYVSQLALRWDDTPEGQGPTGRAIRTNSPQTSRFDEAPLALWGEAGRAAGFAAALSLPLSDAGTPVGTLNLYSGDPEAFDPETVRKLAGLAERVSVAIVMAGHQQRLRLQGAAMDAAANGIFLMDADGRLAWGNQALWRLTGYSVDELQGRKPRFFNSGSHGAAFFREILETVRAGKSWEGEFMLKRKDQAARAVQATFTPLTEDRNLHVIAILQDITENKEARQRLQHMALHDTLTNLPNRALFHNRLKQALARARRNGHRVAVQLLDLDHFKVFNDALGHAAGDTLLQQVAARLAASTRESDTLTRLGGDEFAVIQADLRAEGDAAALARKLLGLLEAPFTIEGHAFHLSASIGIALFPHDGDDPEQLLKQADMALFKAKDLGRANYQFFSPDLNAAVAERLRVGNDLRAALARDEFRLFYQPRVELATGRVIGMEALVRWEHPELGLVPPSQFIPIAEETGLIVPLGTWVLKEACRQTRAWLDAGLPPMRVAVNVSAVQLNQLSHEQLTATVQEALDEAGLAPEHLELELTESMLMRYRERGVETLSQLRHLGIRLAIDDFGTGYSSLNYLSRFPIDVLKIDQSFIGRMLENPGDAGIVRAVIALGHSLGIKVLAEGVESAEQLQFLRREGCDDLQGFYFSRPVRADEFPALVLRELGAEAP